MVDHTRREWKQAIHIHRQTVHLSHLSPAFFGDYFWAYLPKPNCTTLTQSQAENLGPIAEGMLEFYNYHPDAPHDPLIYNPSPPAAPPKSFSQFVTHRQLSSAAPRPEFTSVPPLTPPDPQMIFLDGLSNNLLEYDLATQNVTGTVVVPSTTGPLGIRPVSTGAEHEVWTANSGTQVTVIRSEHANGCDQHFDTVGSAVGSACRHCLYARWKYRHSKQSATTRPIHRA